MLTIRRKVTLRLGGIALALAAAGVAVLVWPTAPADAASSPAGSSAAATGARALPVAVRSLAEPESGFVRRERYVGTVEARRATELAFERSGLVAEVLVDEGDAVEAGAVVARLERDALDALRGELEARRERSLAQLAELEAGPRTETIDAARARLASLREQLELAVKVRERREELVETNAVSVEVLDQALTSERTLVARIDEAEAALRELETGTRPEQLEAQRAAVAELVASIARVEADLDDAVLIAPFAGVVVARRVDEGAVVATGAPIVRLLESAPVEARVGLPRDAAEGLAVGDQLDGRVGSRPVTARVLALPPEIDAGTRTRTVRVSVAVPGDDAGNTFAVDPGATLELLIERREPVAGHWLPLEALTSSVRGTWSCYVVVDEDGVERVRRAALELLFHEGERVYVRGTLVAGDRVIVSGSHRVVVGQRVEAGQQVDAGQRADAPTDEE